MIAPGRDAGQPRGAGAAHQPQQHGFRLIVTRVRHADAVPAERRERVDEKLLPGLSCRDFDREALTSSKGRHIGIANRRSDAGARGERAAERRILVCRRAANVVIQMGKARELQVARRRELAEEKEQRDRIGPARHRGHHARLRRPQPVLCGKGAEPGGVSALEAACSCSSCQSFELRDNALLDSALCNSQLLTA